VSVYSNPEASTRTRTSPGPAFGMGTSTLECAVRSRVNCYAQFQKIERDATRL